MMHCMIAIAVTSATYLVKQTRITPHIIADKEKSGLDSIMVKRVKHPWRDLRDRPVIKCQIYDLTATSLDTPYGLGKQYPIK